MKVAVIGLGYVGLPLAIKLSQLNYDVLGIDINISKVNKLKSGHLPFAQKEPKLKEYFEEEYKKGKIVFTSSFEKVKANDVIFINVDTPILNKTPNYHSLESALKSVSKFLKNGVILIIESTVAPGTTEKFVIPQIEKHSKLKVNKGFFVATVPERIRPNHIFEQLTTLSRVIGVSDKKIEPTLNRIYSQITSGEIDFTDLTTAETVKTVENSFRDVNIAFANEVAIACEKLGVDVWKVREFVNKSPFHNMHKPGAGVGGHCIPKDPWLLASSVKSQKLKIIETAREINDNMPKHIFNLAKDTLKGVGKDITNSTLAIFGYAYVENADDIRNSPTESLVKILKAKKIRYKIHDPHVKDFSSKPFYEIAKGADCLILMVGHEFYRQFNLKKIATAMSTKIIIDGRNFIDKEKTRESGFIYKGVGDLN